MVACAPRPDRSVTPGSAAARHAPYAGSSALPGAVRVEFRVPRPFDPVHPERATDFWDLPWPSELWKHADGGLDLDAFPGRGAPLLEPALGEANRELRAFSLVPVVAFRMSGPLAAAELPSPAASLEASSPLVLIDVDPASPERGKRWPLEHRYYPQPLTLVPANSLVVEPVGGFVLRPRTLYAAVVRRSLDAPQLGTSVDLEAIKSTSPQPDPIVERARRLHEPAFDELERHGIERADVAAVALFRTQDPLAGMLALYESATHLPSAQAPRLLRAEWLDGAASPDAGYRVLRGYYCTPSFQAELDAAPFLDRGGLIRYDQDGHALVAPIDERSAYHTAECGELLRVRFVLSVPSAPMPRGGWPHVVAAHGTTGDAFDFTTANDVAGWAAAEGYAVAGTDQPLHGGRDPMAARPGSRTPFVFRIAGIPIRMPVHGEGSELAFYQPFRPAVMRDNLRQAAADLLLLSRLLLATDFATARGLGGQPILTARDDRTAPRFDAAKLVLFGHSQGSQSVVVVGAVDPLVRAVVLSGCAGDFRRELVERRDTNGLEIAQAVLGMSPGEIDRFHPVLGLAQTVLDPVDPQIWARAYRELLPGRPPRSVLHIQGLGDTMAVPSAAETLGLALGAQPLEPILQPIAGLELTALTPAARVSGNAVAGAASIGWLRLAPAPGRDGHFVLYDRPAGPKLLRQLLAAIASGTVPPTLGPVDGG